MKKKQKKDAHYILQFVFALGDHVHVFRIQALLTKPIQFGMHEIITILWAKAQSTAIILFLKSKYKNYEYQIAKNY